MTQDLTSTQEAYSRMREALINDRDLFNQAVIILTLAISQIEAQQPVTRSLHDAAQVRTRAIRDVLGIIYGCEEEARAAHEVNLALETRYDLNHVWLEDRGGYYARLIQKAYSTNKPNLHLAHVLDFGCGDGRVSANLVGNPTRYGPPMESFLLYDQYDGRSEDVRALELPFTMDRKEVARQAGQLPGGKFDLTILNMVLHHCDDPLAELAFIAQHSHYAFIGESIVGKLMDWDLQYLIDWLYNRGLHPGHAISVPGKFFTLKELGAAVEELNGAALHTRDEGIDLLVAPEHHVSLLVRFN